MGDNGAGKSTLVKILAGVHAPSSGTIRFQGEPVTMSGPSDALDLGIATVFQDLALCENLDVVANIYLGQEIGPLAARRSGDGGEGLDAAERARRPHPERARRGRLAVGRAAADGGHRALAAARPEDHHARRADGGAGRGADRRGAEPGRAAARPRPRGDHDQPQHGGRARRGRPDRGAAARAQQRHLHAGRLERGAGRAPSPAPSTTPSRGGRSRSADSVDADEEGRA